MHGFEDLMHRTRLPSQQPHEVTHYPYFPDAEETEMHQGEVTYPHSHGKKVLESRFFRDVGMLLLDLFQGQERKNKLEGWRTGTVK